MVIVYSACMYREGDFLLDMLSSLCEKVTGVTPLSSTGRGSHLLESACSPVSFLKDCW